MADQALRKLAELIPAGLYETPTASQEPGIVVQDDKGLLRIHLILEGGYELEIPVTQDAMEGLARLGRRT